MDIHMLEASFLRIQDHHAEFAAAIYENLFQRAPETRKLFENVSMERQQAKALSALAYIIMTIRKGEKFEHILRDLGRRHQGYHVPLTYYPLIGDAILDALARYDPEWSPAQQANWSEAINLIASIMMGTYESEGKPGLMEATSGT